MSHSEPAECQTCATGTNAFNLKLLFALLFVSAVWLALYPLASSGSRAVLAVIGLTWLFGCWKTRRAVLWILPAMYVPYVWLLFDWQAVVHSSYRQHWIGMWWQLPGLMAEVMVHPLPNVWFEVVTAATTVCVFLAVVTIGRSSPRTAMLTALVVGLASIANSYLCWVIYCN